MIGQDRCDASPRCDSPLPSTNTHVQVTLYAYWGGAGGGGGVLDVLKDMPGSLRGWVSRAGIQAPLEKAWVQPLDAGAVRCICPGCSEGLWTSGTDSG